MMKKLAIGFGAVMLIMGIFGFVPGITEDDLLFGVFEVNAAHNAVHLISGLAGIAAGLASDRAARLFFQIFGVLYGAIAVLGFATGDEPLLGVIAVNHADHALHVVIALFSLIVGFVFGAQLSPRTKHTPAT